MGNKLQKLSIWSLGILSVLGIIGLLFTAFYYLKWNGFAEQGEVNFSTLSWLIYQGHPLYTDLNAAERYSIQHGPIAYLAAGGIMKLLGPGYITAKLSGVLAMLIAVTTSWIWFSKLIDKKHALFLLGLETWMLFHWHHSYFIRPDSLMFLCTVISMYILTTSRNTPMLVLGMAIPLGVMINLKVHGVVYFFPITMLAYRRLGWKNTLYAGGLAAILAALPFLLPQISLKNYVIWLSQSLHHGFTFGNFMAKIAVLVIFILIFIAVGVLYRVDLRSICRQNKPMLVALGISSLIISIIASKSGSGTNHLMPLIPMFMYMLMQVISTAKRNGYVPETMRSSSAVKLSYIVLSLMSLLIVVSGIGTEGRLLKFIHHNGNRLEIVQELQSIEKVYSGKTLEVGYGEERSYANYRDFVPLPVFDGNPLLIEAVGLMDMKGAGLSMPHATIEKLEEGFIQVWLIPRGNSPFNMKHGRSGQLFDEPFRQAFLANYSLATRAKYFDVWVYNKAAGEVNGQISK